MFNKSTKPFDRIKRNIVQVLCIFDNAFKLLQVTIDLLSPLSQLQLCFRPGLPSVVMFAPNGFNKAMDCEMSLADACRELEKAGADVVGLNCFRGPDSMIDVIKEVREKCKVRSYAASGYVNVTVQLFLKSGRNVKLEYTYVNCSV